jgi:hypothetical protein
MNLNRTLSLLAIAMAGIAILFSIVQNDRAQTIAYQELEGMVQAQTESIKDLRAEIKKLQ